MKKILLLFLLCSAGLALPPASAQTMRQAPTTSMTFSNPLDVQLGDPYVLYTGKTYYMYGTGGAEKGFSAYSSKDLVHWHPEGQVYFHDNSNGWSDPAASWGGAYWAPEVYAVKGEVLHVLQCAMEGKPKPRRRKFPHWGGRGG